jgi:hypothetical protein
MRTAPFAPYPLFLLPMPGEAATVLARALHERGEEVLAANGALPAVELFAAELTQLGGGQVQVSQHTRLHELGELVQPSPVPGHLEAATEDDVELVTEWWGAFAGDSDEQADRPCGASANEVPDRAEILRLLRAGQLWFWVTETGIPVHLTRADPPSLGVARLGPVYTPPTQARTRLGQQRSRRGFPTDPGRGRAGLPVHRSGEPVVDMANLVIIR